jgi:hypothetical protein
MNTDELLREARARGATFQVIEEGRLRVQAPSPLPEDLMAELRQHKTRILFLLAGETAASMPEEMGQEDIDRLLAWAAHASRGGTNAAGGSPILGDFSQANHHCPSGAVLPKPIEVPFPGPF